MIEPHPFEPRPPAIGIGIGDEADHDSGAVVILFGCVVALLILACLPWILDALSELAPGGSTVAGGGA